ncbi:MAG TPA: hypothetical protein PLH19_00205 [Anaerolineae bacterium]|nr:hypothetical protein [Anaerolineae bacterium]HQH36943.1 hypothetical protein [Anaerolineae bacterium]
MKFYDGEVITFNTARYRVQGERLGRGAISDAYLALLDGIENAQVVLKIVRDDAADDIGKAAALQREAQVLTQLNQAEDDTWQRLPDAMSRYRRTQETASKRRIIALLDTGDMAPGQPLVVQEIAPPTLERFDVTSPADERRVFAIAQAVVDVIALTHHSGMSLKDFEPATKGDRFRVQWLDEEHHDFIFKMIDWNVTGGPESMAQDLFFFGGHLYYLLTGHHIPVDAEGRPPANLGMGNLGWSNLTAGSRQIVARLLHRDVKRRYPQIEVLAADVAWWNDVLAQIETSGVFRRLDDRLWQAKPAARYDRVLAIADLALRLNPPADARQSFEQSRKQAHDELDKENWLPIAQALVTLGTRAYEKADQEFAAQLKILSPESEAARLATIYQRFARVGQLLKLQHQGADERRTPEWEVLESRMIKALVERRWQDAQGALAEVIRLRPESRTWEPLQDLEHWITGGTRYTREIAAALAEAENHLDELTPDWLTVEAKKIDVHAGAVKELEKVQELAPFEPEFKERLTLERTRESQRRNFLTHYVQADENVAQGETALKEARAADESQADYAQAAETYQNVRQKFAAAAERFDAILREDPAQRRAQLFARQMQTRIEVTDALRQQALALHAAQQEIVAGRYDAALEQVRVVLQLAPTRTQAREMQAEAEAGARLLEQARSCRQNAETYLNNEEFEQALAQLQRFDGWDRRALRDLAGGQTLPDAVGARPFHLQTELRSEAGTLQQRIEITRDAARNIQRAWDEGDYAEAVSLCEALQTRTPLTPGLRQKHEEARRRVANRLSAAALLAQPQSFDDLRQALDDLRDDQGRAAQESRNRAAEQWQVLCQALAQDGLGQLGARLREGAQRFPQSEAVFSGMNALVERAMAVAQRLQGEGRPYWLSLADRQETLARLAEDLDVLAGPQSWTELRQRTTEWRATLLTHLEDFIQEELERLEKRARSHEFRPALEELDALWNDIPQVLHNGLSTTVQERLRNLSGALRTRLAAEHDLGALLNRLATTPDYSFQAAAQESKTVAFPTHAAVSTNDLAAARAELERAATMELAAALQPVNDLEPEAGRKNYAQVIHIGRDLADTPLDALAQATPLRTKALRESLKTAERAAVQGLHRALQEAVNEQKQHPTADPQRVLALYYQAWWQRTIALELPSPEMRATLELPKTILAAAAEQLLILHDMSGFREPELLLTRAEAFNNALGSLPLDKVPFLPEKMHPADIGTGWRIADGALNALKEQVGAFKKLLEEAGQVKLQTPQAMPSAAPVATEAPDATSAPESLPSAPVYRYDAEQVRALQTLTRDVQQAVKRLRDLWQALELLWNDRAGLAQVGKEAGTHYTVATQLGEAQRLRTSQAMQGLALLYKELENSGMLNSLDENASSLLALPRQALQINYEALQQELIAALGRQIAGILALPDAVTQLQQQILTVPQSRWLAEKAYQAIRQGVDEQASHAEAEGRRDTASRLWEIVQEATEPWATEGQVAPQKRKSSRNKSKPAQTKTAAPAAEPVTRPVAAPANKSGAARPTLRQAPPKR